jgi:hypothetical protein
MSFILEKTVQMDRKVIKVTKVIRVTKVIKVIKVIKETLEPQPS